MLIPRRVKFRKQHHPTRRGAAKGGTKLAFGDFGIQAIEPAYVTNRQIESARIAMTRHIKRGGARRREDAPAEAVSAGAAAETAPSTQEA